MCFVKSIFSISIYLSLSLTLIFLSPNKKMRGCVYVFVTYNFIFFDSISSRNDAYSYFKMDI